MNTLYFKYAIEVERTRSITQAAENLFMAQPNLSKAIKELEETLGIGIFERTPKGVFPTPKGFEFLQYARNVIGQIELMESLHSPNDPDMQCLRVSISRGSYIADGLTKFVAELDTDKGIDLSIQETNSMQTINNIAENKFSLGVIRYNIAAERYFLDYLSEKNLCYDVLWEFEYLALMSKNHALAKEPEVKYSELVKYLEIVHGDDSVPYLHSSGERRDKIGACTRKRISLYERCNQFDILTNVPRTYIWASPIPEALLKRHELVQRKCYVPDHKYKDLLIYPRNYVFSDLDEKFISKIYISRDEMVAREYN